MKLLKLTPWVYFCLCGFIAFSCKKRIPDAEELPDRKTEPLNKVWLPVKIVHGELTIVYEYLPNTTRLKEIRKSTGYRYVFEYDQQDRLFEYQIYHSERFSYFAQIGRDLEGKINKIVKFDVEPIYQKTFFPRGQYTLQFDVNGRVSKVSDYGADKKLIEEKRISYDDRGNIRQIETGLGDASVAAILTHDLKNGIFKNISSIPLVFVLHGAIEMLGIGNNVLSYLDFAKPEEDREITYEYNNEGYPVRMNVTRRSRKETHLITYIELDLP